MQNIDLIKEQVKSVISYSQNINDPKVDELIDRWLEAKRDFIECFDGKFIYTYPTKVQFELDEKERQLRINDFVDSLECHWNNAELANFVYDMRDSFFNNLTNKDYLYKGKMINKGSKLVKSFKYFESDDKALEAIQNEASRLIQEDKIEGYLHLSVHPLDYLSASENVHNWRSCHALDGDYRAGNLSYMLDKSTIMTYLSTDKEERLPNFPEDVKWNSKKWRVWLHFSDDWNMIFAGRQYPFFTKVGLDKISNELLYKSGITPMQTWSEWHKDIIKSYKRKEANRDIELNAAYIPVGGKLVDLHDLVTDMSDLHFNDVLRSSFYSPMYIYRKSSWFDVDWGESDYKRTKFHIGAKVPCLSCGRYDLTESDRMYCDECDDSWDSDDEYVYCESCGRRVLGEDAIWVNDTCIMCYDCAANETGFCEICGSREFNSNLIYDRRFNKMICSHCKAESEEE